jgi:integrase/recombinase XerD
MKSSMLTDFLSSIKKRRRSATYDVLVYALRTAEETIGKPLDILTYDELQIYLDSLKIKRNLADSTMELMQRKFIQYYTWMFNQTDDPKYHKMVRMIKNNKLDKPKAFIQPQDILTVEEAKKIINVATLERDRCLIAVMFESGMRVGELLSLSTKDLLINDAENKVTFNVGVGEGCKSDMPRSIVCTDVHGYVIDWLKCNPSTKFMPLSAPGVALIIGKLYKKAGINKPCNPHMLRHSAITHAASIGMTETQLSYRFWGIPHSNMVSTYIHLNVEMQAQGYLDAKGFGNENKVINPLASKCVICGRLIQSGNLCKQCSEIKELRGELTEYRNLIGDVKTIKKDMDDFKALMNKAGASSVNEYMVPVNYCVFPKDKNKDKDETKKSG